MGWIYLWNNTHIHKICTLAETAVDAILSGRVPPGCTRTAQRKHGLASDLDDDSIAVFAGIFFDLMRINLVVVNDLFATILQEWHGIAIINIPTYLSQYWKRILLLTTLSW